MEWLAAGPILVVLVYTAWQQRNWRYWKIASEQRSSTSGPGWPLVAIIVPFRNEAQRLPDLLADLRAQDYPPDRYKIVLVDDHSTDGFELEPLYLGGGAGTSLINAADYYQEHELKAPKKAALQLGIASTEAEIIVTTDADCRWSPQVLSRMAECFVQGAEVVLGPVFIAPTESLCDAFQALDLAGYQLFTAASIAAGTPALANGAHFAFRRHLFLEVDGYAGMDHLPSGDDVLLLHKFANHIRPVRFGYNGGPESLVTTLPVKGWQATWRQRLRWASKAGHYTSPALVWAQGLAFATSLAILLGLTLFWVDARFAYASLVAWGLKALVDYLLLRSVCRHYDAKELLSWYGPVQLIYPFYLVAVGSAALLGFRVGWKGRR